MKRFFPAGKYNNQTSAKKKTMRFSVFLPLTILFSCAKCFIVPEEFPSLLSLVYSNIPPIKKGTDSRIGLGFRLGPHADFQVLFELGPQSETQPLGSPTLENTAKREILVMENPQTLVKYVNNFVKYFNSKTKKDEDKLSNTVGGKWINWWKKNIISQNEIEKIKFKKVPGIDDISNRRYDNSLKMKNDISNYESSIVDHLSQLYKQKPNEFSNKNYSYSFS